MSAEANRPKDPIEVKRQKLAAQLLKKRMREAAAAQERLEAAMEMSRSVDVHDLDLTDADLEVDDADLYDLDLDQLDLDDDESFDGAPAKPKQAPAKPKPASAADSIDGDLEDLEELDEMSYGPDDFGQSRFLGESPGELDAPTPDEALTQATSLIKQWLEDRRGKTPETRAAQRAAIELVRSLERASQGKDTDAARLAAVLAGAGAALGCLLAEDPGS